MKTRLAFFLLSLFSLGASAQTIRIDRFSVAATAGQTGKSWHGQMRVQALDLELTQAISPRTEVAFVLTPMNIRQPKSWFGDDYGDGDEDVLAVSGSLLMRRLFRRDSARAQWYAEAASGPMWAQKAVPASTSRFNFITRFGAGTVLLPRSRTPVVLGYRFQHISNGGYSPRNPGLNVSSLTLGLRWRR
jgi:hypothetical protein